MLYLCVLVCMCVSRTQHKRDLHTLSGYIDLLISTNTIQRPPIRFMQVLVFAFIMIYWKIKI